jgi:hypothetical protein
MTRSPPYRHTVDKNHTISLPKLEVPAAPKLTVDGLCSECRVRATSIDQDQIKICPVCYAVLEHDR